MRLSLILFGISHKFGYYNNVVQKSQIIDYKKSVNNYKKYIFEHFRNLGYDIDVFFATNMINNDMQNELINIYKPIRYEFIKEDNLENKYKSRNTKLQRAIQLCINYSNETKTKYDLCFVVRFDLLFKASFNDLPIRYEMINLSSKLEIHKKDGKLDRIDDNMYILPFHFLVEFNKLVIRSLDKSFHFIIFELQKVGPINYLYNTRTYVKDIPLYDIVRS